ncbi:MAG: alpha-ketoglutarate-dependent dioxygenase AlkB [Myxococcales bacterium]|nr:alpha-ketoglutarate-dependent dioxygenase AlkB [Myxococcales bacterium]USN51118.1 MAG: alpha-ketoglutarate-dependent dioxygenase AlkB [Myxococcales bacterium]
MVCNEKPVISAKHKSLSCPSNLAYKILIESGDVLVFGGPARKIWHGIHKIIPNTSPGYLPLKNSRINYTFRCTKSLLGKEYIYSSKKILEQANSKTNIFYKF